MIRSNNPTIALLMSGDEIMAGDIIDSNSATISQALSDIGLAVTERVAVGDHLDRLEHTISRLCANYDCLIINGGLGPTSDDLTAEAMANTFNTQLTRHNAAHKHVTHWCESKGFAADEANLKQAILPAGAEIFANAPGSAPAFYLSTPQCLVIATPGVPSELRHILQHDMLKFLQQQLDIKASPQWQRYTLFGIGESRLQQLINTDFPQLQQYFDVGYRAGLPTLEFKIRAKADANIREYGTLQADLVAQLQPYTIGFGNISIAKALVAALKEHGKTVASAESCTGGLIAREITQVPGASEVFPGSIVSYANAIKISLLGVQPTTIEHYGAVSEQTANEMLTGIFRQTNADYAVAVTGIAGPGGGTEEKPAGTVWIAWGTLAQRQTIGLRINFARDDFQTLVSAVSMDLIRRQLLGISAENTFLERWKQ